MKMFEKNSRTARFRLVVSAADAEAAEAAVRKVSGD
jgi:hypothetical protein